MKEPKFLLIFKIVGVILTVTGIILFAQSFFDPFSEAQFIAIPLIFFGSVALMYGFLPTMSKLHVKTTKYMQQELKDELKDISITNQEIRNESLKRDAKAIKEGFTSGDTVFCKYCGGEIEKDSIFCKFCGKKLN